MWQDIFEIGHFLLLQLRDTLRKSAERGFLLGLNLHRVSVVAKTGTCNWCFFENKKAPRIRIMVPPGPEAWKRLWAPRTYISNIDLIMAALRSRYGHNFGRIEIPLGKNFRRPQFSLEISGPKVVLLGKFSLYRAVRAPIGARTLRLQPHQPHRWSGPGRRYACLTLARRLWKCAVPLYRHKRTAFTDWYLSTNFRYRTCTCSWSQVVTTTSTTLVSRM